VLLRHTGWLDVVGTADLDEVWARYADLSRWAEWSPQIRGVEAGLDGAPTRRLAEGVVGSVRGPAGVRVPFVVEHVDEAARVWAWQVTVGPVGLHLHHGVHPDPTDPARTHATLRVTGPAPVVLSYLPLARLALRRLVRP
jgi:hypothetical protein